MGVLHGRDHTAGSALLRGSTSRVIAPGGLSEGLASDATEHLGAELGARPPASGVTACRIRPGSLLSVLRLPDALRCHSEPAEGAGIKHVIPMVDARVQLIQRLAAEGDPLARNVVGTRENRVGAEACDQLRAHAPGGDP